MNTRERQAVARHEAGHLAALRWIEPGTPITEVWVDGREDGARGKVEVARDYSKLDGPGLARVLVVALMGYLLDPETPPRAWPPTWSEAKEDVGLEGLHLILRMGSIDPPTYYRLARIALELADDVVFRTHVALLAYELERRGRLTGEEVEALLAPPGRAPS